MFSAIRSMSKEIFTYTKSQANAGAFSIKTPPKHQQNEDGVTDPHRTLWKIKFLILKNAAKKQRHFYIYVHYSNIGYCMN